jgi:mannonate dehydratase
LSGIGDATLNGRELAVASYLDDHVIPCLIGRDPQQIEDIWQYLYRGAYWRRGPVTMSAIAAVDTALWDIKAKAANMPLYQLLGGASRTGVLVYGHANGRDIQQTVDEVQRYAEMGYKAIRAQSGVPGLEKVYGVGRGTLFYEPADADLPSEHDWSTEKYLAHTPRAASRRCARRSARHPPAARRAPPPDADRGRKAGPGDLEPLSPVLDGRPTPAENQEAFRLIRQHTTTPLAVGEVFNTIWDCKDLIANQLIDYIRTTIVHAGGITHLRRIADFAALYQVRTGCHGATDLSPVCMGAALHLIRAEFRSPNTCGIQNRLSVPHAYSYAGYMHPAKHPVTA